MRASFKTTIVLVSSALSAVALTTAPWDATAPGTISFRSNGICGNGEPSYYGFMNPSRLTQPNKFFIEMMGGAICFNRGSCLNPLIGNRTMDVLTLLAKIGVPSSMMGLLTSGGSVPLALFETLKPGYVPLNDAHPMFGRRGIYVVACTGDINLGRRNVTYTDSQAPDTGAGNCNEVLVGERNAGYRGCQNYSVSGLPCQKWTAQTPHGHGQDVSRNGLGDHNFCRNPDGEPTIWCYTASPTRWDFCEPKGKSAQPYHAFHIGGKNMHALLTELQRHLPNLDDIAMYGGSGGGVSSAVWATAVADMWPAANVTALVDSGLHVFPGTQIYKYFYDECPWGPGPRGQGAGLDSQVPVPNFDWRARDALASHVASFDGRVKLAYLSCIDDHVVFEDRAMMLYYANGITNDFYQLLDGARQRDETWEFLATLHQCSPPGAVFSYIQNCSDHHQTRKGWSTAIPNAGVTPKQFVDRFLQGLAPNVNDLSQRRFWYLSDTALIATCSSPVRRRRGTFVESSAPTCHALSMMIQFSTMAISLCLALSDR